MGLNIFLTTSELTMFSYSWNNVFFVLLWTPAHRSLSKVNYILPMFIFYGRLILRPRSTEVRETFTRGGPSV